MTALYVRNGRKFTTATAEVVLNHARGLLTQQFRCGTRVLDNPLLIETFLKEKLASREHEIFAVILLDRCQRLIKYLEIARGTHNSVEVFPREIVKVALEHNATSVVLVHNHPSGESKPSPGDIRFTQVVQRALALVDVKVADHFVVGKKMSSLFLHGLLR